MHSLSDFIDRVKCAVPLQAMIERDGVQFRRQGNGAVAVCPLPSHDEKTPSFHIFDDERFHCYGCHRHGDVLDYLQEKRGLDFMGALHAAAGIAGIPVPEQEKPDKEGAERRRAKEDLLERFVQRGHEQLLKDEAALSYLQGRGLTLETIKAHRVGVPVYEGKMTTAALQDAGLLNEEGRPTINGRIMFPIIRNGKVANVAARVWEDPDAKPKYRNLDNFNELCPTVPFNSHLLRRDGVVVLCEGVIDALLMGQAGVSAVATIGTYVKPEWLPWFRKDAVYALCYDNDANGAGQKATRRIGEMLFDAGFRVSVISLPHGKDPADILSESGGPGEFKKLLSLAKPLLDHIIDNLPPTRDANQMEDLLLKELFPKLRRLPAISQDGYLERLCKVFGTRKPVMRATWESFLKSNEPDTGKSDTPDSEADLTPVFQDDNPVMFNPAQSFAGGLGMFAVPLMTAGGSMATFLITSERKALPLSPSVVSSRGLVFYQNKYPDENTLRWPIGRKLRNCVPAWLNEEEELSVLGVWQDVLGCLMRHVSWEEEQSDYYELMALWIIGTYVHQLFRTYPYIHVKAIAGSGKTTLLRVVEALAFNGCLSAAITESVISRTVNSNSPTLCIDEAEKLRSDRVSDGSSILEVLNSGYKKGGTARKAGSKASNFRPENFDTYSPKILASINRIDDTLSKRCIDIEIEKTTRKDIPPFLPDEPRTEEWLWGARGTLYCWALQEFHGVNEAYVQVKPLGLSNRPWELWQPVIALAEYFASRVPGLEELPARMRQLAANLLSAKSLDEEEYDRNKQVMGSILRYVASRRRDYPDEFYPSVPLCDWIKKDLEWDRYKPQQLHSFIFKEARLADNPQDKRQTPDGLGGNPRQVRLRADRVLKKAVDLFGFTESTLEEMGFDVPRVGILASEAVFADS